MTESEFKVQTLETEAQWRSGLIRGLRLDADGISLFANPAFESWLAGEGCRRVTGDIVVDECGQIYWSEKEVSGGQRRGWSLFRHDPRTGQTERVISFNGCTRIEPSEMWLSRDYLWVFDRADDRLLAVSRENYQIVYELEVRGNLIDMDFDPRGIFYALVKRRDGKKRWMEICPLPTPPLGSDPCFKLKEERRTVAIAVGREGVLFLLDAEEGRLIRVDPRSVAPRYPGAPPDDLVAPSKELAASSEELLQGFEPSAMQIDERGVIFLAGRRRPASPANAPRAELHLFAEDGSYLNKTSRNERGEPVFEGVPLPETIHDIRGIGFGPDGEVFLATDRGLARFSLSVTPVGQDGVYYSKTLDNGEREGLWHRVVLNGRLPDKTAAEVYYYASDSRELKDEYDAVLKSEKSVEEQEREIKRLLEGNLFEPSAKTLLKGPEVFKGAAGRDESEPDMLTVENRGRFLWLKLRLVTFDERSRPSIRRAQVYYPRISYLRYLPPVYREDELSAAFLERFLALFEGVFHGLDRDIDLLHRFFDPVLAPPEFLRWLASWINLSVEEGLPADRLRRLIRRAPDLYGRKGTPAALTEFLEIYTGRPVFLTEYQRSLRPLVIGGTGLQLGRGTILVGAGVRGFRLGDTSVAGYAAIRDRVRDDDEPFLPAVRRFRVLVAMERPEFNRRAAALRRIIDEQKPAHTAFTLGLVAEQGGVGAAVLGVSAVVAGTEPYQIGVTPLGGGYAVAKGPQALRLERGAHVGSTPGL